MAESAVAAVLSKFGELALREAKVLLEVGDDMLLLRDQLEWLQAFIRDADRKRRAGTDGLSRVWVGQTREVAFEAEDALDEFFYQVDQKNLGYRGWKIWRKYLTGFWTQIIVRHALSSRIQRIKNRLNLISENQKEYKLEHTPLVKLTSSTTDIAAWRDGYKNAVGFDNNVKTLQQMLLREDDRQLMFISIFGDSGIGKSTLANVIQDKMKGRFDVLIDIMMPDCNTESLLQHIYLEIAKCQPENNIDISDKIRGLLANKRYLVILCGISSKTMLNCVRACLPDDNNGSSVMLILDTESEEVVWHANNMNKGGINGIHRLSRLDKEKSGELFRSRAFRKEPSDGKEEPSDDGKENNKYNKIVYEITGGHPLAIVVLAGLLRFKEKPVQWEAVLQQLRPGLGMEEAQDGEVNMITGAVLSKEKRVEWQMSLATPTNLSRVTAIERVFWESFEDLPNDLKSCLLYFAAFPMNIALDAHTIVWMWIAEGFIKPQKGKTMEELGHNYLKELVLRCLVQVVSMKDLSSIWQVRIHKSLQGFLQSEVHEAGFVAVHDMHDVFVAPLVRRLSFLSFGGRYIPFTRKFPKLRSFICWVEDQDRSNETVDHNLKFLHGSKFLRVLYVRGLGIKKLPDEIGDMIHLRYLCVTSKNLKELPSSIKRLLNLQTLDISRSSVKKIDPCFWKIKGLRHVHARELMLPPSIEKELDELQTLMGVEPAEGQKWDDQGNCPLHKMKKLRKLQLNGFKQDEHGVALKNALMKMDLLVDLRLQGDVIPSCVFTGPSLRHLEVVLLNGIVQWPAPLEVRTERPNLHALSLRPDPPTHIQDDLRKVGFIKRWPSAPVYQLSYKQEDRVAPKPNGEAMILDQIGDCIVM